MAQVGPALPAAWPPTSGLGMHRGGAGEGWVHTWWPGRTPLPPQDLVSSPTPHSFRAANPGPQNVGPGEHVLGAYASVFTNGTFG